MSACILCEYMTAYMDLKTKTTQHPLVESVNEMGPNHSEQLGFFYIIKHISAGGKNPDQFVVTNSGTRLYFDKYNQIWCHHII